jgi:translation initiation factor 1 (eIF-1/SUI1)
VSKVPWKKIPSLEALLKYHTEHVAIAIRVDPAPGQIVKVRIWALGPDPIDIEEALPALQKNFAGGATVSVAQTSVALPIWMTPLAN